MSFESTPTNGEMENTFRTTPLSGREKKTTNFLKKSPRDLNIFNEEEKINTFVFPLTLNHYLLIKSNNFRIRFERSRARPRFVKRPFFGQPDRILIPQKTTRTPTNFFFP